MQAGNALSSAQAFLVSKPVTKVDIYPDKSVESADVGDAAAKGPDRTFFGGDGLTFRDVLDAINPLNHIPIVSDILQEATGHHVSTASRLVGGTLMGGPIGFVTALASVIFENATGESPTEAAYAALTGESTTQIAANSAAKTTEEEVAQADGIDAVKPMEMASLEPAARTAIAAPVDEVTTETAAPQRNAKGSVNQAVLDLYGNSPASAHASYKKMQMLPYLRDVTTSKVL